jgi:Tol biopolymer transport system component
MRMRTTVFLAALIAAGLAAAPAQARIVYVKDAGGLEPVVYVARNSGNDARRLGTGRAPTISPDGRWVAFVSIASARTRMETVVLQKLGGGSIRLVMRSGEFSALRFSPDSSKLAAIAAGKRVRLYNIERDKLRVAAEGDIRGYSFSPDSRRIVYGRAKDENLQAASDLFVVRTRPGSKPHRITDNNRALNPVWGPDVIVFDHFRRRREDAPAYNLWTVDPADRDSAKKLTHLKITSLVSGLVPLDFSKDGRRLLADFVGQDAEVGFTVRMRTGRTRAMSTDFERGIVGFGLSRNGRKIIGHTGGPDPTNAHDVIKVPFGGGEPKVIVEDAAFPDWNR